MNPQFVTYQNGLLVPVIDPYASELAYFKYSEDWFNFRNGFDSPQKLWPIGTFTDTKASQLMGEDTQGGTFESLLMQLSGFKEKPKSNYKEKKNRPDVDNMTLVNSIYGMPFASLCGIDLDNSIHRVSFDALSFFEGAPSHYVEIKKPLPETYEKLTKELESGELKLVAEKSEHLGSYSRFYSKIQYGLALLPIEHAYLLIYSPELNTYINVQVKKDEVYIQIMLAKLKKLHEHAWVAHRGNTDDELAEITRKLQEIDEKRNVLAAKKQELDEAYNSLLLDDLEPFLDENDGTVSTGDVIVRRSHSKGSVSWQKVAKEHLKSRLDSGEINLEEFRGKNKTSFKIVKLEKEEDE